MGEFKASILRLGLKQELSASSSSKKEIRAWERLQNTISPSVTVTVTVSASVSQIFFS